MRLPARLSETSHNFWMRGIIRQRRSAERNSLFPTAATIEQLKEEEDIDHQEVKLLVKVWAVDEDVCKSAEQLHR